MSDYSLSEIKYSDKRSNRLMDELLIREGITRDSNLDYSLGLFDDDYNLVATGSCFKNTLRCMAVDSNHQGEGLLNEIVNGLIEHQYSIGNFDLFLYTKCESSKFFNDLGFYEIARVDDKLVFMENKKDGFSSYLSSLSLYAHSSVSGAIVMNANPFTLGHQYLIEEAAKRVNYLHVFVISEDSSLVPFDARYKLVQAGTAHLDNVILHQSGSYIISGATFPSYFLKDEETVIASHAKLDIAIFSKIAKALNITVRFVGEEPFSKVTGIYNNIMCELLPKSGVDMVVFDRKCDNGNIISASTARKALKDGDMELFKSLVPTSTYAYFETDEGKTIINSIKHSDDVIHY